MPKKKKEDSVNIKISGANKLIEKAKNAKCCTPSSDSCGGCAYILGAIGAAVYFVSNSVGFWAVILAILKALVWPAFLVYGLLKYLGL
jgi:hypothetical protein